MTAGRHRRRFRPEDADPPITAAGPVEMPSDPAALAAVLHGDPAASRGLTHPAGWCAPQGTPGTEPATVTAAAEEMAAVEARAALYAGAVVRPGGIPPRWGCSTSAHEHLGWCSQCPGIDAAAELMAWRVFGDRLPPPDVAWARLMTGEGRS